MIDWKLRANLSQLAKLSHFLLGREKWPNRSLSKLWIENKLFSPFFLSHHSCLSFACFFLFFFLLFRRCWFLVLHSSTSTSLFYSIATIRLHSVFVSVFIHLLVFRFISFDTLPTQYVFILKFLRLLILMLFHRFYVFLSNRGRHRPHLDWVFRRIGEGVDSYQQPPNNNNNNKTKSILTKGQNYEWI